MPDYSKTSIYKLCCLDPNITNLYIGSTCNFTRRKNQHKSRCNNVKDKAYNFYLYKFIRDNGGWDNWTMVEIDKISCTTKREKEKIEYEYIQKFKSDLNMRQMFDSAGICEHNRRREKCVECHGRSICEHNKIKDNCKECHGRSICEHNRRRRECKECHGSGICEHNKIKDRCKECKKTQTLKNLPSISSLSAVDMG